MEDDCNCKQASNCSGGSDGEAAVVFAACPHRASSSARRQTASSTASGAGLLARKSQRGLDGRNQPSERQGRDDRIECRDVVV